MRTMLQGLDEILHGLVAGDLVKVQKAARGSGVASALDVSFEQKQAGGAGHGDGAIEEPKGLGVIPLDPI
jgi:hypothetical protein